MGGTSYENNAFKNISRNNSQNQKFPNNSAGLAREQSQSPPLKPIDEVVTRSKNVSTTNGPNATGSKFYVNPASNQAIPSNKDNVNTSQNKIIRKKSRNTATNPSTNLANLSQN
ncbi:MAG: hypothetical protein ACMG6E_05150 [Candidatus Roizmanbacteria bacterium]